MKPYFEEDGITIYCADCRDILPHLSADLVLTDPPYRFENNGGGFYGAWEGCHEPRTYLNELRALDCVDCEPGTFLPLLNCQSAVICCNKSLIEEYLRFAREQGKLFDVHVLVKSNPIPVKQNHFVHDLEYLVLFREPRSYFWSDGPLSLYRKNFEMNGGNTVRIFHPAEKPIELMAKYIRILCPENGIVLDPFMGSGTTLRAAKDLGRRAIGVDSEERYCAVAAKRLSQKVLDFGSADSREAADSPPAETT